MSYLPHTTSDVSDMLARIGVARVEDLFDDVPEDARFPDLDLPVGLSQMEVSQLLEDISSKNVAGGKRAIFLGAGAYNHYCPAPINHIISRGEFLTAYTPYQPEVSQGTLQAIFEYQSMICALTGMEVSNASHYDGATSLAEAVVMALSHFRGNRNKVVISPGIHPEYADVVATYTQGMNVDIVEPGSSDETGRAIAEEIDAATAIIAVGYPNFFGEIQPLDELIEIAHLNGALVCVVADPIALGLLRPPGWMGADIVVGEGQSLGIPLSFGGPYLGFFATREQYVRKMAGRLVGETVDSEGTPGYVLTLATREQHIRRQRATSNICTNQGLLALAAAVYMSLMGKTGLRKVAELCYHKAHYAADQIDSIAGYEVVRNLPFFREFAVKCPRPVSEINRLLLEKYDIIGGYDLGQRYPDRAGQMLIAVTEMNSKEQIDRLVAALTEIAE